MTVLDFEAGSHLQHFLPAWTLTSSDLWVLDTVRHGYQIEFLTVPLPSGPFYFRLGYSPYTKERDEDGGTWG
ncbi:hypothetical protein NDU88_009786 [Pleurodeles waltl]|uniref:Uncharacterized protein n=1 Tax=Pleurodeles waltl TaxID=8319 RepID=A0AAV7QYB5_PLEWA|nr:hypothetical protein NDU88_009786 [Pleurodeles waltl]